MPNKKRGFHRKRENFFRSKLVLNSLSSKVAFFGIVLILAIVFIVLKITHIEREESFFNIENSNIELSPAQNQKFRVGFIEDFLTVSRQQEIETARTIAQNKNLDLILFHENFFGAGAATGSGDGNYITLTFANEKYIISSSTSSVLLNDINTLENAAKDYQTNMGVVVKTKINNDQNPATYFWLINKSGEISYTYNKANGYSLFNISSKSGENIYSIVQICLGPENYHSINGQTYLNAQLFLRPGWGTAEAEAMPIMEYQKTGDVSQATFDFINNSQTYGLFLRFFSINSREELINKIKNEVYPLDWLKNSKAKLSESGDLNKNGYLLIADQVGTNGAVSLNGQRLNNLEYGPNYEYTIAEIEMPRCTSGADTDGNNIIDNSEVNSYIQKYYLEGVNVNQISNAIFEHLNGCV